MAFIRVCTVSWKDPPAFFNKLEPSTSYAMESSLFFTISLLSYTVVDESIGELLLFSSSQWKG